MKKIITLALALAMALSLCACSGAGTAGEAATGEATESSVIADSNNDGQIEVGTVENVEVNVAETHLDAAEASASGNWEALFVPIDIEGRAIDMTNVDLTPTAEELEAMKKEPAYGRPIHYFMSDGCTSGPTMADHLGYYEEAGLTAEGVKGSSDVEALGTNQVDVAVGMMAKMLVPITNGVDITFVGGAHIGCKSLYVLADSEYATTADLKGQKISVPNGIGKSDYNITALLLDADGINYSSDVELVQVSADACVTAMENGEIAAALLSDTFAYSMVKDGKLKMETSAAEIEKSLKDTTNDLKRSILASRELLDGFDKTVEGFNSGVRDFSEFNYNLRGTVERMDVAMRDVVSAMRETAKSVERSGRT